MKTTKAAMSLLALCALLLAALSGCSKGATPPPAQASGTNTPPQGSYQLRLDSGVDVLYFEESTACDCMAETGAVIKETVQTHFAKELQNGTLRFYVVYSDNWANREVFDLFKNQPFDLFVVEFEQGRGVATPLYELWGMIGDDEAIDRYVRERVAQSLEGLA